MRTNIKKALAVLMTLVMLCGLLPMGMLSVSAATPVLDLNFNDGTTGGFDQGSAVMEGPDGSYCLKWTATGGWSTTYKGGVSGVYRDGTYVITFKAKASVAGTMGITIQDGSWANVYYTEYFQTTTSWKEYSITTNVGQNPNANGVILFKFQDQNVAMDLWVDDLTMAEYEEPAPEEPDTPAENLVTNGDFETGDTTGWTKYQSTAISTSAKYEGTYGVNLVGDGGWGGMLNQSIGIENGGTYTLSFWYKTVSVGMNWQLSGTSTSTKYGGGWLSKTDWTQETITFTSNGDSAVLLNFNGGGNGTAESVYLDNVTLYKEPEASFDGYIYNGDFEIGSLQNWNVSQTASVSADAAHTGNYGAHITNPGGQYGGMIYQETVGIEAGKTYTLSLWIKVTVGYVNFQVMDGTINGDTLATTGFNSNAWVQFSTTITPSTNVLFINFCGGGTGTNDQAYVDDVMIVEEKDPSFDGYITNGDMETGKAHPWVVYSDTTVNTASKYEGDFGLYLGGAGDWGGLAYQTVTNLKVGKEYTISMKMKILSGGVNVQILNGSTSGDKLAYSYYSTSNASDWTDITLTFTAVSNTIVLNYCGDGTNVAAEIYVDNVTCGRVGGEVFPEELHKFGGASIKENADGIGLAFKFDIIAADGQKNYSNEYVANSAKIALDDTQYDLVRMGAVMTNDASVGQNATNFNLNAVNGTKVINVEGRYLAGVTSSSVSFAVRILDIPERHQGTEIYARPYYVYKDASGTEVTIYGRIKSNTYAKVANPKSSIKILSIGHSFSKDVMETYLWNMFKEGGYDEVVIGYLYIAGCPMPKHLYNIQNNRADYEYGKNTNGTWVKQDNVTALTALKDEEWDYVNIQSSPDFIGGQTISGFKLGVNSEGEQITLTTPMTEYECITPITDWIQANALNSAVKTDYHMIWSFSQGCDLWSGIYHKNPSTGQYDQMVMYNNIITQTKQNVLTHDAVYSIIPCGTSIQNGRTSFIGDNFNELDATQGGSDGYHLNTKYGDYTAALTWYCHYSGDDAYVMSNYVGQLTDAEFDAIAEAVNNAINTWDEVTESTHK